MLKGFDQTINLILDETHERVYSATQGVEQVPIFCRNDDQSETRLPRLFYLLFWNLRSCLGFILSEVTTFVWWVAHLKEKEHDRLVALQLCAAGGRDRRGYRPASWSSQHQGPLQNSVRSVPLNNCPYRRSPWTQYPAVWEGANLSSPSLNQLDFAHQSSGPILLSCWCCWFWTLSSYIAQVNQRKPFLSPCWHFDEEALLSFAFSY